MTTPETVDARRDLTAGRLPNRHPGQAANPAGTTQDRIPMTAPAGQNPAAPNTSHLAESVARLREIAGETLWHGQISAADRINAIADDLDVLLADIEGGAL